jgi:hypothetical protein
LSGVEIFKTKRVVVVGLIPKRRKDSEILELFLEPWDPGAISKSGKGNWN